jgi:AraC-like DNA-binding protein
MLLPGDSDVPVTIRGHADPLDPGETTIDITLSNFFGVISILVGFTCLLLAVFLLAVPSARRLPNRLLAVFLILTAIELSAWLWVTPENAGQRLNALRLALGTLQMPIFYGFFVSTCYSDFKLRPRDAFHLIPFVLALVLSLPGSQVPFAPGSGTAHCLTDLESHVFWIASHVQYYAYMIAVVAVLMQFRGLFRAHYSGDRSEVLTWLTQLAAVSLFAHTLILVRNLLAFSTATDLVLALQVIGILLALAITSWIALKSLLQPHLFRDVDRRLLKLTDGADQVHQRAQVASPQLERLQVFMDANEPYLDPGLTLASLSAQIAMTPRDLSELLNRSLGVHFFDFINGYRIKKAQHLLLAEPRQSVLQILYAVGFNSKSSFNTAFKKHSGLTPSAFRAQQTDRASPLAKAPEAFDF